MAIAHEKSIRIAERKVNLHLPWMLRDGAKLTLEIHDNNLIGSENHSVRIDLYPLHAPSHPERHLGYWDVPLVHVKRRRSRLVFRDNKIVIPTLLSKIAIEPIWTGPCEPVGYFTARTSLWEHGRQRPQMIEILTTRHFMPPPENQDLPLEHVLLSITERCNLECPMCNRQTHGGHGDGDVSLKVLAPVMEAAPHVVYAAVQGLGEPLLNENVFAITSQLRRRMPSHGRIAMTTNATLLEPAVAARIIDSGLNSFIVSIDGACKDTYEKSRTGASFDQVIRNVAGAVAYRASSGRKDLWFTVNFVIMKHNVHEIPAIVKLAASLGLDCVAFHHMKNFRTGQIDLLTEDTLLPLFAEAREIGNRQGVTVMIPGARRLPETRCLYVQTAYVWLSGEVVPCFRMEPFGHPWPVRKFGNVRDKGLLDIWKASEYREFRHRVWTGNRPKVCVDCNFCDGLMI